MNIGQHGESDIFGHRISDGKAIYIEVKLPGESPRQDQDKFLKAMRAAGAIAGCAHSVEEALSIVNEGRAGRMYVNPFFLGVATTIAVESILLIVVAIYAASNKKR